jgi:regulator of sigma E protease
MEIISTIFYFLIVIGILVFIHELGHFLAARSCGMRADIFALGIGFRLFGYNRITGFKFGKLADEIDLQGHTDYRICAFPIGGYVKIAGMIDESMDKEFIKAEPKPWEYRSKPVWKRMIVITAGVFMNILLAFFIFYALTLIKGKTITETTTIGYVNKYSVANEFGLKEGDKILTVNNDAVENWDELQNKIYLDNLGESVTFDINRDGKSAKINIPKEKLRDITERNIGIYPEKVVPFINSVVSGQPAEKCGIRKGDVITEFAGEKITHSQKLIDLIKANVNKETSVSWNRDGNIMNSKVTPVLPDSTIGIEISAKYEGPIKYVKYSVFTAFPKAGSDLYYFGFEVFFKSIAKVIKGDIPFKKAIGGPVKIAQASAQSAEMGFLAYIGFLAMLSISLAVINILPFPALDGGHFVILLIEGIFRKPVSYKVQIALQNIGFIILLAFMLFVIYNDIISIK